MNRDFDIIKRNIQNLTKKEDKMLKVSQNWTQTINRIKIAKETREKDNDLFKSIMQIKLNKNLIMKHNVN